MPHRSFILGVIKDFDRLEGGSYAVADTAPVL